MLLRFFAIILFIPAMIIVIYKLLRRIIYNICRELSEPTPSLDDRADEIARKTDILNEDCIREAREAAEHAKHAKEIKRKLKR